MMSIGSAVAAPKTWTDGFSLMRCIHYRADVRRNMSLHLPGAFEQTLLQWLGWLKDPALRQQFMDSGKLQDTVNSVLPCFHAWCIGQLNTSTFVLMLRLLRNACALGGNAILLAAGLHQHLPAAIDQLHSLPPDHPGAEDVLAVLAQLIGNYAASSTAASCELWSACFPAAFQQMLSYQSARVRGPVMMALYSCCRSQPAHTAQLCSSQGACIWSLLLRPLMDISHQQQALPALQQQQQQQQQQAQGGQQSPTQHATSHPSSLSADKAAPTPSLSNPTPAAAPPAPTPAPAPGSSAGTPSTSTPDSHKLQATLCNTAPEAGPEDEWLLMLVGCIVLKHGQLQPLLACLGDAEGPYQGSMHQLTGSNGINTQNAVTMDGHQTELNPPSSIQDGATNTTNNSCATSNPNVSSDDCIASTSTSTCNSHGWSWSHYSPTVLHLLSHELQVMKGQPVPSNGACISSETSLEPSSALEGVQMPENPVQGLQARASKPWQRSLQHLLEVLTAAAKACAGEQLPQLSKHVLEAALEVFKSLGLRDDQGIGICEGEDPVLDLVRRCQLVHMLLAMLKALQPVQKTAHQRQRQQQMLHEGAAPEALVPELHPADLAPAVAPLAQGLPAKPPYMGYRGDILAVLANAVYNRPEVAKLLEQLGGVELILAQCQVDDESPLAREWALWAVRNLCDGNPSVQARIAQLEVVTAVETPELQKLGMRLELDKATNKMRVVRVSGNKEAACPAAASK